MQERKNGEAKAIAAAQVLPRAVSLIRHHAGTSRMVPRLSAAARAALLCHDWSSGEAELDACIKRGLILARDGLIQASDLGLDTFDAGPARCRARAAVLRSLRATGGERAAAARKLGISPRSLRFMLAELKTEGVAIPGVATTTTTRRAVSA